MSRFLVKVAGRDPRHPYNAGGTMQLVVQAGTRRAARGPALRAAERAGRLVTPEGVALREYSAISVEALVPSATDNLER